MLSCVQLFATLWTPTRLLCPCNFPGKNTGVRSHSLLQGNLPDPGIERTLVFCNSCIVRWILYHQPPGKPNKGLFHPKCQQGSPTPPAPGPPEGPPRRFLQLLQMNYHKLPALKHHDLSISWSGGQRSDSGLTRLRSECGQGWLLPEAPGERVWGLGSCERPQTSLGESQASPGTASLGAPGPSSPSVPTSSP